MSSRRAMRRLLVAYEELGSGWTRKALYSLCDGGCAAATRAYAEYLSLRPLEKERWKTISHSAAAGFSRRGRRAGKLVEKVTGENARLDDAGGSSLSSPSSEGSCLAVRRGVGRGGRWCGREEAAEEMEEVRGRL